jgi:small conductance mechanosensitive channel
LLLFIGLRVARMVGNWIARKLARSELDATTSMFLGRVILVAAQIVVLLAVIQTLGVPTTSLLAVLGAAGLAIGLAMKDSLSNIASGVLLVTLKPFRGARSGHHQWRHGTGGIDQHFPDPAARRGQPADHLAETR